MAILVTGANGQLGHCIKAIKHNFKAPIDFKSSSELDLTNFNALETYFQTVQPEYCINCAAYTNVEAAEDEFEQAEQVNHLAVKQLADVCQAHNCVLIHISTDYVFDGLKNSPYLETDQTNPINNYGLSKLHGETAIKASGCSYFILRSSWLYSQYQSNFFNFICSQIKAEKKKVSITTEQIGTPTNANDLAEFISYLINTKTQKFGLYHFSNIGELSWYDFSLEIVNLYQANLNVNAVSHFKTKAKRPAYSVLSKNKLATHFKDFQLKTWQKSVADLIEKIG